MDEVKVVSKENLCDWLTQRGVRWLLQNKYGCIPMESETKDDLLHILHEKHDTNPCMMPLVDPNIYHEERDIYYTEVGKQADRIYRGG